MSANKFVKLLELLNANHKKISHECYPEPDSKKKTSAFIMENLKHEFPELNCAGRAEEPCIRELIQEKSTAKTAKQIIDEIGKLYPILYRKPNTLKQWLSEAKTTLDKKFHKHPLLLAYAKEKLHVDPVMKVQIQKSAQERVVKTNTQSITFDATQVYEVIKKLKTAQNWEDRAVAVSLAVGCRQIELFKISKFEKIDDQSDWIKVIGVAKDREAKQRKKFAKEKKAKKADQTKESEEESEESESEKDSEEDAEIPEPKRKKKKLREKEEKEEEEKEVDPHPRTIKKPLLIMTSDELQASVEMIRKQSQEHYGVVWANTPNKDVTKRTNYKLNTAIRVAFGRDDITFHRTTRALYARITYDTFNTDPRMQLTAWISTVLGHQVNSIETGLSYQAVNVKYDLKTTDPNLEHKLTEMNAELKRLHDEIQKQKRRPQSDLLAWDADRHKVLMFVHLRDGTQKTVIMPRHKRTKAIPPNQAIEKYVKDNFDAHLFIPSRKLLLQAGFGNDTITKYFKTHYHEQYVAKTLKRTLKKRNQP